MTFTLSDELASLFVRRVPARQRSRYVAEAVAARLADHDREILRACEVANQDSEVLTIEKEFDSLSGEIAEPWTGSQARRGVVRQSRSRSRVRN